MAGSIQGTGPERIGRRKRLLGSCAAPMVTTPVALLNMIAAPRKFAGGVWEENAAGGAG